MSVVMNNNFSGTLDAPFTGDSVYTNLAGTAPVYKNTANDGVRALRFAAAAQGIINETFTATGTRVFSRIYKLSAAPTATSEICQVRVSAARGPAIAITSSNTLRLLRTDGSSATTGVKALPIGNEFRITFTVSGTAISASIFSNTSTVTPLETISSTIPAAISMTACRDGFVTAAALGAGVQLDLSWPQDDNATDPGPRNYVSVNPSGSTIVMSNNFIGLTESTFAGDVYYANIAGVAPTYARAVHQKSLLFAAENQGIVEETFAPISLRIFSRIYKLSAPVTATCEVAQARIAAVRGPALAFTNANTMRLLRTDGSAGITGSVQLPVNTEFRVTFVVNGTNMSAILFPNTVSTTPLQTISIGLDAAVSMTAFRDGIITATALGTDVSLQLSWPIDDSATDPGPRLYPANIDEPPQAYAGNDRSGIWPWESMALRGRDVQETYPITARSWTQTGGTAVTLVGTGAQVTYEAPATLNGTTLTFRYNVTAESTITDTIVHVVNAVNERAVIGGVEVPLRINEL